MHRARSNRTPLDTDLIEQLMLPAAFDHPVTSIERIETHISWVILTDTYAYKIKKPVALDFLDFSNLEQRRYYCEQELRLNRPWAENIYLDVVAITNNDGRARFGGRGTAVEYAVRMYRFDQDRRLDRQLALGKLKADDMRELGQAVAARHLGAPRAEPKFRRRVLRMTTQQMRDNLAAIEGHVTAETVTSLKEWTESQLETDAEVLAKRYDDGFVRDCHGDLHLANLVRMPDGIKMFDCIEFNEDLRRIDVVCDIAFLVMDLVTNGRRNLAALFLNRYLEYSGDYGGAVLLDLYFVYRCLVRAKVAVICSQESKLQNERLRNIADADRYCRIALRQTWKPAPTLIILFGLSGSGKTWVAAELMASLPAIRLRSDVERKRLFGLSETASSHSEINEGLYTADSCHRVYTHLVTAARVLLNARHNVILDAAFLRASERDIALEMADLCRHQAVIVHVRAPAPLLQQRLQRRQRDAVDASEAGPEILDYQRASFEALSALELTRTIVFDNADGSDVNALAEAIRRRGNTVTSGLTDSDSQ